MKVALIGSTGQLGRDLATELASEDLAALSEKDIDITRAHSIEAALEPLRPEVVVNAAALTDVPGCEADPVPAFEANALGPLYLAKACSELGAALVHVSTDYVFDGRKDAGYVEEDVPAPLNVYGTAKLAGEHFVRSNLDRHAIVRTSGLFGLHPSMGKKAHNFVQTMLRLADERDEIAVVDDERLSPTWTRELAAQIHEIVRAELRGIIHAAASGGCSWHEFAEEIFRLAGKRVRLRPITAAEYAATAGTYGPRVRRPPCSVLHNARLRALGLDRMRPWQDGLRSYLREIGALNEETA